MLRALILPALTIGLALATPVPTWAEIAGLAVEPTVPACDQWVTLAMAGHFPDSCWEVVGIEPFTDEDSIGLIVHAVDNWEPGEACLNELVGYSSEEIFGPFPLHDVRAFVRESVTSLRVESGDYESLDFLPTCPPAPGAVPDLLLGKKIFEQEISFYWGAAMCGTIYTLYGDSVPDGTFDAPLGTMNAEYSTEIPIETGSSYFLVGAKSACGVGPKRGVPDGS